jgi:hypothetical protein
MPYFANYNLKSVKVKYTSGESGEYTFTLSYNGTPHYIITTPEDVPDGWVWEDHSATIYRTSELESDQNFTLVFESREYDDGFFRGGDDVGKTERSFGINDNGIHTISLTDGAANQVEFLVEIAIHTPYPSFGSTVLPPEDTVPSLRGVRLYEDWKYNLESSSRLADRFLLGGVRSQNFDVGEYDLPYDEEFIFNGRFPFPVLQLGVRPDSVSSLKVGTGYYVELYDQLGQRGEMKSISENTPIMPDGWNDRVKSIRVSKIPVPR